LPIPDSRAIRLPLLKYAADGAEHSSKEAVEALADVFQLSEEERKRLMPNRRHHVFYYRLHWALSSLKAAGLLTSTRLGYFRITGRGIKVLDQNPQKLDKKFLKQFPEYLGFIGESREKKDQTATEGIDDEKVSVETDTSLAPAGKTPEEILDESYFLIRKDLAQDLLTQVKSSSPEFFERLVVELLVRMGYGGSIDEAGKAIGKSGDEGVDGFIKEDQLGLDVIYIQAKKWEGTVERPEVQKFAGALQGKKTKKGVFITTGSFSADARRFVEMIESKIVLIDGQQLADYMVDNNIWVSVDKTYEIKKINSDYFVEL
jgi:restriction system protein